MAKLIQPNLPDRVIEVPDETVAVHKKSGWVEAADSGTSASVTRRPGTRPSVADDDD